MLPLALQLLVDVATGPGCPLHLVGDAKSHPFAEAQIACDAYLAFAVIDQDPASRDAVALNKLLDDALSRGQASFRQLPTLDLAGTKVSSSVLARGYLLAMMGGMDSVRALPHERRPLYDAIAQSLIDDLADLAALDEVDDDRWLPSYKGGYWPCDHALAASGLALHGDTDAARALAQKIRNNVATQVDAKGRVLESMPRGTVLAWTAAFLALGGHDEEAAFFADRLARDFCDDVACREWPRGVERDADSVSGPILFGYGSGASALAIAAFRITGDDARATKLEALMTVAPMFVTDVRASPAKFPLENAILAWGSRARPWTSSSPAPSPSSSLQSPSPPSRSGSPSSSSPPAAPYLP